MITRLKAVLRQKVEAKPLWFSVFYASLAAFLTYSCMYAFRKPFAVASYEDEVFLDIPIKIWFVSAQVIGYTLSKFIGIKYVSELKPMRRAWSVIKLVGISQLGLAIVFFAPVPLKIAGMFLNGLPLGIIWGLVFSYLEGRKTTEILGAALSVSFIIASGVVKSIGKYLIVSHHVSEYAMPFVTGIIFAVPLVLSVFMLDMVPQPTPEDIKERTLREPMGRAERHRFLKSFLTGIVLFVVSYSLLTVYRELRDNFSNEIWASLGSSHDPSVFSLSELPVAFLTLVSLALISFIRSNRMAFILIQMIVIAGFGIIIATTLLYVHGVFGGMAWMIGTGTGLYMGYVPFNALLYERMIATFHYKSNIGFVMYVSDAFGYLGSVAVIFLKNFFSPGLSWIAFFISSGYWIALPGILFMTLSLIYFNKKYTSTKYESKNEYTESVSPAYAGAAVNQ